LVLFSFNLFFLSLIDQYEAMACKLRTKPQNVDEMIQLDEYLKDCKNFRLKQLEDGVDEASKR
jgi:hypothetical protein